MQSSVQQPESVHSTTGVKVAKGRKLGGPWWKRFLRESRAYLVEYLLVLIATGILLGVITTMFSSIIDFTDKDRGASIFDSFAYTASVSMIAGLLVAIPLLLVLTRRIQGSESQSPALKDRGWRKAFLGIFLVITSLFALGYAIGFMYEMVSYFASFGLGSDGTSFPWRGMLESGVTTLLFLSTTFLYSYDYRYQQNVRATLISLHRYGLIILAVFFTVIYLATAFRLQRGAFIDDAIAGDINTVSNKIESYQSDNNELPDSLDLLNLNTQQKSRAEKFKYEYMPNRNNGSYTLCAEFKTDTRNQDSHGSQNPLAAFSSSSYDYSYGNSNEDPYVHDDGRVCFEYQVYGGGSLYDNYQYDSLLDQDTWRNADGSEDDDTVIYQD